MNPEYSGYKVFLSLGTALSYYWNMRKIRLNERSWELNLEFAIEIEWNANDRNGIDRKEDHGFVTVVE
jgi:hypothetical protein